MSNSAADSSVTAASERKGGRGLVLFALTIILTLAGVLRWRTITDRGFFFDELWITELSSGHGSDFLNIPIDQVTEQSNLIALPFARPLWQVPSHVTGAIHPPASFVSLRLWRDVFGDSMLSLRSHSATWSMAVVVLTFFAGRASFDTTAGLFAALLSALSSANIDQAQDVRGYTMLQALALLTLLVLFKMRAKRSCWPGAIAVGFGALTMMLTHYFAAGACAAIAAGAGLLLTRRACAQVWIALTVAALVWAAIWLPQLRAQLAFVPETAELFLKDDTATPIAATLLRLIAAPYRALVADVVSVDAATMIGGSVVVFLLSFQLVQSRSDRPANDVWLWVAIIAGVIGQLFILDLVRQTRHLEYVKYFVLANPAICVLLSSLVIGRRWLAPTLISSMLAGACYFTPLSAKPNYEAFIAYLHEHVRRGDVILLGSNNPLGRDGQTAYLYVAHGLRWPSQKMAVLTHPASPELIASLPRGVRCFYFAADERATPDRWLPEVRVIETAPVRPRVLWQVAPMERSASHDPASLPH